MNRVDHLLPQAMSREAARGLEGLSARVDLALPCIAVALLAFGLVMVASSSTSIAAREHGEALYYFWRQLAYLLVGVAAAIAAVRVPMRAWRRAGPGALVAGTAVLALVLVPGLGHEVNGSMRWLRIGPVGVQPSELVKLFAVLYLAGYLVRREDEVRESLVGFLKPIAVVAVVAALLLLEPDYGAAVVLFATAMSMLFLGGVPLWTFTGWAGLVAAMLGAVVLAAPYRVERLTSFLDPWADPFGSGFQLTQALIALGRGEITGVGLGSSVQKLFYLPEAHTDFLFAVLAEELGLVGAVGVILLYALLTLKALAAGRRAEASGQRYGAYVAYGIGLIIGLQAFVNIGVNVGLLPTKGLTLPLMSYGGSSLVASCVAVGLLIRVDVESRTRG